MFVDQVQLSLSAGRGGNGVIAWRREKYIPKGGPAGGNGGHGGSVSIEADSQVASLEYYRNRRILKAQNGLPGGSNNQTGRNGKDLVLKVPLGTLVKNPQTGEILFDFTEDGQKWRVCAGGKGGKGNTHFKTPTHQAPYVCTEGTPGESAEVELELKLIADIGLVGMPNAGKSTLISKLAYLRVKIAPYPFTTLRPNLGFLSFPNGFRLLLADIPGLIEHASEDRGLGIAFLRHVERTTCLLFILELAPHQERDPYEELFILRKELEAYNPALLEKPFLTVLNKIDQEGAEEIADAFAARYPFAPETLHIISAQEGIGLDALKNALADLYKRSVPAEEPLLLEELSR